MKKKIPIDVFRITINLRELEDTIYDLTAIQSKMKLGDYSSLFLARLNIILAKARANLIVPTYQQTGRPESGISFEALGGTAADLDNRTAQFPEAIPFDRRILSSTIKPAIPSCTQEEQLDAEFEAADHKILTGEDKHWSLFLKKGSN